MGELVLPEVAARHLAYHLRMAVGFAAAGNQVESASEGVLAWTILTLHGDGAAADAVAEDLPEMTVVGAADNAWDAVQHRTHSLARELQAHFVSEGQHEAAALYEAVAAALHDALPGLRPLS